MRINKYVCATLIVILFLSTFGCFKEIVETRETLPDIVWPGPPEVARIRFVNSISKPDDLNIRESLSVKLWNFFKGKVKTSIIKPYGLISDNKGRLYVVDNFRQLVHVFNSRDNEYYVFPDKETTFVSPISITIDKKGIIYVSDSSEGVVKAFADHGKTFLRDIGRELLMRPTGLAYNSKSDELLVVDTKYSQIVRFSTDDFRHRGMFGSMGVATGSFNNPTNIFTDSSGQVYITDSLNFRIQIFTHNGKFIRSFGKNGDSPGYFARPKGVAVDSDGNIYVVDALFDNVQIFNKMGELLMDFGKPGNAYGEFWLPTSMYIDAQDRIYVSDSYNKRVQVFQYMNIDETPLR
jgi:DNA-binding beta-propeller fold protein YncE